MLIAVSFMPRTGTPGLLSRDRKVLFFFQSETAFSLRPRQQFTSNEDPAERSDVVGNCFCPGDSRKKTKVKTNAAQWEVEATLNSAIKFVLAKRIAPIVRRPTEDTEQRVLQSLHFALLNSVSIIVIRRGGAAALGVGRLCDGKSRGRVQAKFTLAVLQAAAARQLILAH